MYRKSDVMYHVSNDQLTIYRLKINPNVINQCYEECCNKYTGIHNSKTGIYNFEIENILNSGYCYNLVKTLVKSIAIKNERMEIYDIEYDKLVEPYPVEVLILEQIKKGNLIYINQLFSYIDEHATEKPFLHDIYGKVVESTEIEVLETLKFDSFMELVQLLKTNDSINRELLYSLEIIEKYHVLEDVIQKVKK